MSNSIIKVQNLSKRYRIGLKENQSETLMGQIADIIKSPWNNLKRIREMSRFGDDDKSVFWALRDISFEVKQGEVMGIIGKNGAGKSTLLKILSQISEPTSGRVEIHGRVASLLEVGTGFHPELSGRDNIYMNGTILGMTKKEIDTKLDEIIDFSGVEKFIDTPVKFYSSGMKVRLGFSVAAHLEPEILIIDEVLAVGDYEFQKKCLGKMEDVAGQGRTVLFVSHNMEAVRSLCSRSILLQEGAIRFEGKTQNVIEDYLLVYNSNHLKSEWDYLNSPGNDWVKFKSISLNLTNSETPTILSREDDLIIKTEFWLEKDNVGINLSLHLFAVTGECIMNVISQVPVPILNKGLHYAQCIIPSNLLNEGGYSISMMIVKDTTLILFQLSNALSFELIEPNRNDMNWFGRFAGFIHPELDFKILI